ncbi:hypothetical protein GCM10023191_032650 [Actinoallomurus oryzae]|uniref:Uncharacterized protein n=1 Tax=Actinoallomurus oryzae TaxID=502180 RepID=A0ABP8PX95_9ACTN
MEAPCVVGAPENARNRRRAGGPRSIARRHTFASPDVCVTHISHRRRGGSGRCARGDRASMAETDASPRTNVWPRHMVGHRSAS